MNKFSAAGPVILLTGSMELYIYPAEIDNVEYHYVSILPQEIVFKNGLTERSILGKIIDPSAPFTAANISINPLFVTLLQKAIREGLGSTSEIAEEAQRRQNGVIVIIDERAKGSEHVEGKYIAGLFRVEDGKISSYVPSPNYQLFDEKGAFRLPAVVIEHLVKEISPQ